MLADTLLNTEVFTLCCRSSSRLEAVVGVVAAAIAAMRLGDLTAPAKFARIAEAVFAGLFWSPAMRFPEFPLLNPNKAAAEFCWLI